MDEIILTNSNADLPATLTALQIPDDALMYLERVPSHWLNADEITNGIQLAAYDEQTNWVEWERGRIFCEQWELRWDHRKAIYTGVMIDLAGFDNDLDLSSCSHKKMSYYLWGERLGSSERFIELQVSRVLTYPIAVGRKVKMLAREWFNESGEMIASRFIGMEGEL